MAPPRKIFDDEIKDVHVWLGMRLWQSIARDAQKRGSSVSALIRALAEERYGGQKS